MTQFIHLLKWVVFLRSFDKWGGSSSSSDLTEDPTDISVRFSRGLELLKQSEISQAQQVFEDIIDEDSDYAPAHFGMGCVYTRLGLRESAEEALNRALKLDPVNGEAHLVLARLLYDDGDFLGGYEHVNKAVQFGVSPDKGNELIDSLLQGGPREDSTDVKTQAGTLESAVATTVDSEDKPFRVELFQRLNNFIDERDRIFDVLSCILILLVCFYLLRGTLHDGYPSKYFDATLAFYVAKIKMLFEDFGLYTNSWYFGFELLRFYPPLSTILPFVVAKISGNLMVSYYVLCFLSYAIYCIGIYFFIKNFLKSRTAGLFSGILWTITHVYFISFQGHYWETARLFGSCMVPWVLYFTDRAIAEGKKKYILTTVFLTSYAFLSSMLSVFDLVFMLAIFAIVRGFLFPYEPAPLRDEIKKRTWSFMIFGILGVLGLCLWWYLPAVMPYGVGGFLSVGGSNPPPLTKVLFQMKPIFWFPAIQLPITIIGFLGAVVALVRRDRKGLVFLSWFFLSIITVYVIGIQPERLIMNIGLSLCLLSGYLLDSLMNPTFPPLKKLFDINIRNYRTVLLLVSTLVLGLLLYSYLPEYSGYSTVDDTYLLSDEYISASWLSENVDSSYRVYSMYGSRFRGVQWLNTFYPNVQQVLGGFDQGAHATGNEGPFEFDTTIKWSSNSTETYQLCLVNHVKYIVIDKTWMLSSASHAYSKFNDSHFFQRIEPLNSKLTHAESFEVIDVEPLPNIGSRYKYWNGWRVIGLITSVFLILYFGTMLFREEGRQIWSRISGILKLTTKQNNFNVREWTSTKKSVDDKSQILLHLIILLFYVSIVYTPLLFGFPKGGDSANALTMVRFLEKNWPNIPKWNPEWGCGYPFLTFYQPLGIYIAFLTTIIFNTTIYNAYKIIMVFIIFLSSVGLYFFSKFNFKDEYTALFSSILYLSTPGSFNNLTYYGNYSEFNGYPFFFAAITLSGFYQKTKKPRYLYLSILTYTLLLLSHSMTAVIGTIILISYNFLFVLLKQENFKEIIKNLLKILGFGAALAAFWYFPFIFLGSIRQYGIVSPYSWGALNIQQLLGLPGTAPAHLALWTIILAIVGSIIALKRRGFPLFLTFWSGIMVFFLVALHFGLDFIYAGVTFPSRFLPWTGIFISMLGGYGLKTISDTLSSYKRGYIIRISKNIVPVIFIVLLFFSTAFLERKEQKGASDLQGDYELAKVLSQHIDDRVAITADLGGLLQTFNLVSNKSQLYNYQLQSAPNLPWLGAANAYLFGHLGGGSEVTRLCRWFGIEYIVLRDEYDPLWKYESNEFDQILSSDGVSLLRYFQPTDIISVTNATRILVIADSRGYENIFWSLVLSDFDPERSLLITRSQSVDDYNLDELRLFDLVYLYGYSYRNREAAFQLLSDYVIEGGSLFIETGYSPDSDADNLPLPIPISRTEATDFGIDWEFTIKQTEITTDVNFTAFSPAIYGDVPWSVSSTFKDDLREWSHPAILIDDHPLVVIGEYGEGRVAWSGLNLPYHIKSYTNNEEADFLLKIINWLVSSNRSDAFDISVNRPIPERVILTIDNGTENSGVFFRETYFPKWRAYVESPTSKIDLTVYRAGPDLMFSFIPNELTYPAQVIFEYKTSNIEYLGFSISIIALAILILYAHRHAKGA